MTQRLEKQVWYGKVAGSGPRNVGGVSEGTAPLPSLSSAL